MIYKSEVPEDMKKTHLLSIVSILLCLFGCAKSEPMLSISDTVKLYLSALKQQDSKMMSTYMEQAKTYDFTIEQAEAEKIGIDKQVVQQFYQHIFDFSFTLDPEKLNEDGAEISAYIKTYHISPLLEEAVNKHKEEFKQINGEDIREEEKNEKIANILIQSFENAKKDRDFVFVFHLKIENREWKILQEDEDAFIKQLFSMQE